MNLNSFIRSPHLLEIPLAYGTVHIISIYLLLHVYQKSIEWYFIGLLLGGFMYTFIEYWFHRTILHRFIFKTAHKYHHDNPIKLKIIATPLLPVQTYEFVIMIILSLINPLFAVICQVGISISQIIMDFTHLFEHSKWNPWFLRVARNYHKLHHNKSNWDVGHGLTTKFWDYVFNTLPIGQNIFHNNTTTKTIPWSLYHKYPYLKYINIPLPLIDFMILTPLIKAEDITNEFELPNLDNIKFIKLFVAFLSGIIVGLAPLLLKLLLGFEGLIE
jgi:sterol desaturase/sphingolipid hydroxylase (fatty acid hydroxylase superfamily)